MTDQISNRMLARVAAEIEAAELKWKAENGGDDASVVDCPDIVKARAAVEALLIPDAKMKRAAHMALKRHIDSFTEEERAVRWPGRKDRMGWNVPEGEKHGVRYTAMINNVLNRKGE